MLAKLESPWNWIAALALLLGLIGLFVLIARSLGKDLDRAIDGTAKAIMDSNWYKERKERKKESKEIERLERQLRKQELQEKLKGK